MRSKNCVEAKGGIDMVINKVWAAYFSATDTTKRTVSEIAAVIAEKLNARLETLDFTLPSGRTTPAEFSKGDLVVFGTPVYAGRVPNVLLKYLETIRGNGALAVPVVLYGNRNYDDALIELRDLLERAGLHTIAAGAFIGEHSFSEVLAGGRPDAEDLRRIKRFAEKTAGGLKQPGFSGERGVISPVPVKGTPQPYSGYYQPRDRKGNPVDIRKVTPVTEAACTNCKLCAQLCPMGSIDFEQVSMLSGICIKCCACIKKCPAHAKHFTDSGYLYHQKELEEGFARRAEPEWFFSSSLTE
jgi:NAD-dependent dihydropyrimidine dehydrogenase PreA subunit/NAD(P)H-dependent FMN reductase